MPAFLDVLAIAIMPGFVVPAIACVPAATRLGAPGGAWPDTMVLIAAGPCGAMPFVVACVMGLRPTASVLQSSCRR